MKLYRGWFTGSYHQSPCCPAWKRGCGGRSSGSVVGTVRSCLNEAGMPGEVVILVWQIVGMTACQSPVTPVASPALTNKSGKFEAPVIKSRK